MFLLLRHALQTVLAVFEQIVQSLLDDAGRVCHDTPVDFVSFANVENLFEIDWTALRSTK